MGRWAFARVADYLWRRRGKSVRQLETNLHRAVPTAADADLRRLSRAAMRSYLRYWVEAFRLPTMATERITSGMSLVGEEQAALASIKSGREVELFGEKARVGAGPAVLAVRTGAALMPVVLWFEGKHWRGRIYPDIPVPAGGTQAEKVALMTQRLATDWGASISEHPEDWHMLQKVFAADLDAAQLPPPQSAATPDHAA